MKKLLMILFFTVSASVIYCSDSREININAEQAKKLIDSRSGNPDFVILDIRTPGEYAQGHINGSVNIDFYGDDFQSEISKLDRNRTYLIYCRSGNRSGQALPVFKNLGFKNYYNMTGGFSSWASKNYPYTTK